MPFVPHFTSSPPNFESNYCCSHRASHRCDLMVLLPEWYHFILHVCPRSFLKRHLQVSAKDSENFQSRSSPPQKENGIYVCVVVCVCEYTQYIRVCVYIYYILYIYTIVHVHIHIYMNIYIYICTHVYIYTILYISYTY